SLSPPAAGTTRPPAISTRLTRSGWRSSGSPRSAASGWPWLGLPAVADLFDVWVNCPHSDKSGWSRDARGLPLAEAEEFAARQTTRTRIMPAAPPDPDEGDYLPKP